MRTLLTSTVLAAGCIGLLGASGAARAQSEAPLAIPQAHIARVVPGAKEMPDPSLTYKVVFLVGAGAKKPGQVDPGLMEAATYYNTLAADGVSPEHLKIAVVIHAKSTDDILDDAAYRARHDGMANPNLALIRGMASAGVRLYVCGQAVLATHIQPKQIVPQIQLTLWALTTVTNLELRGYVRG